MLEWLQKKYVNLYAAHDSLFHPHPVIRRKHYTGLHNPVRNGIFNRKGHQWLKDRQAIKLQGFIKADMSVHRSLCTDASYFLPASEKWQEMGGVKIKSGDWLARTAGSQFAPLDSRVAHQYLEREKRETDLLSRRFPTQKGNRGGNASARRR